MAIGTMNVNGVLVPGVPTTSITGQSWTAFENVGAQAYPLSASVQQPSAVTANAVPGNMSTIASSNQAQALSSPLSLTHGVVMPSLIMLIAGVVILDVIFFRKGKEKDKI